MIRRIMLVAGVLLAWGASPASAHAELVESSHDACTMVESGQVVSLVFSEELEQSSEVTVDADGDVVARVGIDFDDLAHQTIAVSIPPVATDTLELSWTATSATDGDTTSGVLPLVTDAAAVAGCGESSDSGGLGLPVVVSGTAIVAIGLLAISRRTPARLA